MQSHLPNGKYSKISHSKGLRLLVVLLVSFFLSHSNDLYLCFFFLSNRTKRSSKACYLLRGNQFMVQSLVREKATVLIRQMGIITVEMGLDLLLWHPAVTQWDVQLQSLWPHVHILGVIIMDISRKWDGYLPPHSTLCPLVKKIPFRFPLSTVLIQSLLHWAEFETWIGNSFLFYLFLSWHLVALGLRNPHITLMTQ